MKQVDFLIQIFLTFVMLPIIKAIIDYNIFDQTCSPINPQFICVNQVPLSFHNSVQQTFENIPQMFLVLEHLGIYVKTDFRIEIIETNKLSFTLKIACLNGFAEFVVIRWFAVDDQRFQIINSFNNENFNTQTYLHKNKNVNCEIGIISLISHNFEEFNFNLQIDKITVDDVTVSLKKNPEQFSNCFEIGLQLFQEQRSFFRFQIQRIFNQLQQNSLILRQFMVFDTIYWNAVRLKNISLSVKRLISFYSLRMGQSFYTLQSFLWFYLTQCENQFLFLKFIKIK